MPPKTKPEAKARRRKPVKSPAKKKPVPSRGKARDLIAKKKAHVMPKKKRAGVPAVPLKQKKRAVPSKPKPKPKTKPVKVVAFDPALELENGQWETFCQRMAMGVFSNYSCYMQAYSDSSADAARSSAPVLLANPSIKARIAWIRADALKNVKVTLEQQLLWYLRVRDTPVGYVDDESPIAQEVQEDIGGTEADGPVLTRKVKTPSKMDASKQIDKLMGFEKPQEVNVNLPYEPPGKSMERLTSKGVDVVAILKRAGLIGT